MSPPQARLLRWLGRIFLVFGAPLLVLGFLELGLWIIGFGQDLRLFVPDKKPGYFCINRAFTSVFVPASFGLQPAPFRIAEHKPSGTKRIFVLGESAVMGIPRPEFGFVSQMRPLLRMRHPEVKTEIYNLGITAINSHVIYQAARELARFSPDLIVIYAGNNEVVGPYGPGSFYSNSTPPAWLVRWSVAAKRTCTGQLISNFLPARAGAAREWEGMKMFAGATVPADDPRLRSVYRNFATNLRSTLAEAADQHVPVVIGTVVANLRDCAPFVSAHDPALAASDLARWKVYSDAGVRAWHLERYAAACQQLTEAFKIDPHHADTGYLLGRAELALGRLAPAREHLIDALHFDTLRFRPDIMINEIVRTAAHNAPGRTILVDTAILFGADPKSTGTIAGAETLLDHVHFTWDGDYAMARQFAAACEPLLFPKTASADWPTSEQVAAALGFNPIAEFFLLTRVDDQNSIEPFTGQITFADDRRHRQREILRQGAALLDAQTGRIKQSWLLQALDRVSAAAAADPENPALRRLLMELHGAQNDQAACLADIEELLRLLPVSDSLTTGRAKLLAQLGRMAEARSILQAIAVREVGTTESLQALVQLQVNSGDAAAATKALKARLTRDPDNLSLLLSLADILVRDHDLVGAVALVRDLLTRHPESAEALNLLCQLYEQTGQTEPIFELRRQVATAQPRNIDNNTYLADRYEALGDTANAMIFLQALADSGDASSNQLLRLAKAQLDLGQRDAVPVTLWQARSVAAADGDDAEVAMISQLFASYDSRSGN